MEQVEQKVDRKFVEEVDKKCLFQPVESTQDFFTYYWYFVETDRELYVTIDHHFTKGIVVVNYKGRGDVKIRVFQFGTTKKLRQIIRQQGYCR